MPRDASELARRLAREAEAVCRHYLSNGKREGRYWLVGDVHNTPGRSLFVRLTGIRQRDRPANGLMQRPENMVTCSTLFASALVFATSAMLLMRRGGF